MKQTLLLCAVLADVGMSDAAYADNSSVTLYGILDESIQYIHDVNGQHAQFGLQSSNWYTNRWGITGREDLGSGLSAIFRVESAFDLNSSAIDGNFGRQSYVGLSSTQ